MTIEAITKEQFLRIGGAHGGQVPCPEWDAVRALTPSTGVRFPCRWQHTHQGQCTGVSGLGSVRKRTGFTLRGRCREGYLYVWRDA